MLNDREKFTIWRLYIDKMMLMGTIRKQTEAIRRFILEAAEKNGGRLAALTAEQFGISRQSANNHIRALVNSGALTAEGNGRTKNYCLTQEKSILFEYDLGGDIDEFDIWQADISPKLQGLPDNARDIWHYGVTEMINNAKDHSGGKHLAVLLSRNAVKTSIIIKDDGIGIFRKIQEALQLPDQRQAVLELAKGKLTTDPKNHSGEGVFFSSRIFDDFFILSNDIAFSHQFGKPEDWILDNQAAGDSTMIAMILHNHTARRCNDIFLEYSPPDEYAFNKTVVPLRMASFGESSLISRSQAKRVVRNLEKFHTILLDFAGIATIGQGFADEIFRVYQNDNPDIKILPANANADIERMIKRVIATAQLNREKS